MGEDKIGINTKMYKDKKLLKLSCETLSEEILELVEELAIMKVEMDTMNDTPKETNEECQRHFRGRLKYLFQLNNDLKLLIKRIN